MSLCQQLYIDNTNNVFVKGLTNSLTGLPVNDAAVTMTVVDRKGDPVTGESWPVDLVYIQTSDGDYRGSISHLVDLDKDFYTLKVTAVDTDGSVATWTDAVKAIPRGVC